MMVGNFVLLEDDMRIGLVQSTGIPNPLTNMVLLLDLNRKDILLFATPNITPRFRDCFELVSNRPIQGRV